MQSNATHTWHSHYHMHSVMQNTWHSHYHMHYVIQRKTHMIQYHTYQCCNYITSVDIQKHTFFFFKSKLVTHVESHESTVRLLKSREQRYIKAINNNILYNLTQHTHDTSDIYPSVVHLQAYLFRICKQSTHKRVSKTKPTASMRAEVNTNRCPTQNQQLEWGRGPHKQVST